MEIEKAVAFSADTKKTTLKVIGVGLSKTGTSSLRDALNMLGFPCYHFMQMFHNKHEQIWLNLLQGTSVAVDWEEIFKGFTSTTIGFTGDKIYKQLMAAYPEAKIILTVRDPERWYKSAMETLYVLHTRVGAGELTMDHIMDLGFSRGTFHGRFQEKDYAIAAFERHIEEVKRCVPPQKLLVFDVKQGWAPLCDYLNVTIPQNGVAFPRSNDKVDFLNGWKLRIPEFQDTTV